MIMLLEILVVEIGAAVLGGLAISYFIDHVTLRWKYTTAAVLCWALALVCGFASTTSHLLDCVAALIAAVGAGVLTCLAVRETK